MKKYYDVWLMKQVEGSVIGDFEMIDTMVATSYRDATKTAKELSLTWDADINNGVRLLTWCPYQNRGTF